jgi:hypothetical protein
MSVHNLGNQMMEKMDQKFQPPDYRLKDDFRHEVEQISQILANQTNRPSKNNGKSSLTSLDFSSLKNLNVGSVI